MGFEVQCLKIANHAKSDLHLQKNSTFYTLKMQILAQVDKAKYLSLMMTEILDWSPHINSIVTNANRCNGFIKRNISNCPQEHKQLVYLSLVRSQLEYACVAWDPDQIKDISNLEKYKERQQDM